MSLLKACSDCGELTDRARCAACRPRDPRPSGTQRGYDSAWQRLSKRARRLQPFCTDCGTTADLSVDHSPEAWRRHEAGLEIRLVDVEVVCVRCNSRRGAARGPNTRRGDPLRPEVSPSGKANFQSLTRKDVNLAVVPESSTDDVSAAVREVESRDSVDNVVVPHNVLQRGQSNLSGRGIAENHTYPIGHARSMT